MVKTTSKTLDRKAKKEPAAKTKAAEEAVRTEPRNYKELSLVQLRDLRRDQLLKVAKEAKLTLNDMPGTLLCRALEIKLELA
ncbi:hypothetical protein LCGC14_2880860, partial [marine sediment metagenome]